MATRLPSIRNRPAAAVVLLCAVVLAVMWLSAYQRVSIEHSQAVAKAMHTNSNLAIAFEKHTSRTLLAAEQVAVLVRELYSRTDKNVGLDRWLEQGVIRADMFTIISVVNEAGDVVESSQTGAQVNYSDRDFFTVHRNSNNAALFINTPVVGRVSGEPRVPMSLRMSRPDGSFAGVVVLSVSPSKLTDFYGEADLGSQGLLELTGKDGVVRARKIGHENSFGQDVSQFDWFVNHAEFPIGSFIDDGAALDGVARIVSYRSVPDYPLIVAVGTAYDEAVAHVLQRRMYYFAACSVATAVLLLFTYLLIVQLDRQRKAVSALKASEAQYRATFHQAATGIVYATPAGEIIEANQTFHDMLGFAPGELSGRVLSDLTDSECRETAQQFLARCVVEGPSAASPEVEMAYRRKDGSLLWVHEALGVVRRADGSPDYLVVSMQDITRSKELEARLSYEAMHDMLTGLANRNMFHDRLNHALAVARRHNQLAAVLYMDLDGFKNVNDTHGHAIGDILLQHVGQRLQDSVRAEDTVARFGGDEFAVVLSVISSAADCERFIAKLDKVLSEPYLIEGVTVNIAASIGAAVYPIDGADFRVLIRHADEEMYAVKRARKSQSAS